MIARESGTATSARRPQSLRGHLRKLVSELRQQMRLDKPREPARTVDRQTDAVIRLVAIKRRLDAPLLAQEAKQPSLACHVVLLRIQIHRTPRSATVVHEPHREDVRRMVDLEKRVGLATHRTVSEQRPDDDLMLHFRQTSHGIT